MSKLDINATLEEKCKFCIDNKDKKTITIVDGANIPGGVAYFENPWYKETKKEKK